ncbi:MAG: UvrB/UvrC motif-containing protein [Lentisphaeria bacterium]|nr:UvrB/UvrC motif-containing protein [Lentisphaeria bacterium]
MLCQHCHKNEATIHVQQIVDGQIQSYHLCEGCASKNGAGVPELEGFNLAEVLFDIAGKVAGAGDSPDAGKDGSDEDSSATVCPGCGWTLQQFRKTGYLGCPECYQTFAPQVAGLLKNMHRGERHLGKIPVSSGTEQRRGHELALLNREIENLRKELDEKIRSEEYEQAAVLRDRIQDLSRKLRESEPSS